MKCRSCPALLATTDEKDLGLCYACYQDLPSEDDNENH